MKEKILQMLIAAGDYVSGQKLCEELGVSRTAVWKYIGQLREEGYEIEAATNRGYRLVPESADDPLDQESLEKLWDTKWVGHPLIYKKSTGSTNDDILSLSDQGYPEGTLVISGMQTAGKGRRGRVWVSPPDGNVYMSILLRPKMAPDSAPMSTLVMALSCYQASLELPHSDSVKFGIKWPNDIVVSWDGGPYQKIGGILTEMRMEEREIRDVVIGTGLNINTHKVLEEFQKSAATYQEAVGYHVKRAELTAKVWSWFEKDYEVFEKEGNLRGLREQYEEGLVNKNRKVRILDPKGEYTGCAFGITDEGALIVQPDGKEEKVTISTGEISVRGVMGYV